MFHILHIELCIIDIPELLWDKHVKTVMPNDTATKNFKEDLVVRKPNITLTRVNSRPHSL